MDTETTHNDELELEGRLRAYYEAHHGPDGSAAEVWRRIESRLGEQESAEAVAFARSLSGLYSPNGSTEPAPAYSVAHTAAPTANTQAPRRSFWSPALAAGLVLALMGVVIALLAVSGGIAPAGVPTPVPRPTPAPTVFDFENGPGIWEFSSINRDTQGNDEYKGGVDTDTAHSGIASAYIATSNDAVEAEPAATGGLSASILADPYRGERVRLSGYVKTTGTLWAVMSMGVGGQEVETARSRSKSPLVLAGDTMLDRPILSTGGQSDWQRYEIVLDVPAEAVTLYLGLSMAGKGQIWLDDVVIEAVGDDVPTTDMYNRKEPGNLDFEDGLSFWSASPSQWKFKIGWVTDIVYSGRSAGYLDTSAGSHAVEPDVSLYQSVSAEQYRGSRVRFSAYIKTQGAEVEVIPYVVVSGNPFTELDQDNFRDDPLVGTGDWTKYELLVDVPEEAYQISFGLSMSGMGQVWIDEVRLEREEMQAGVLELIPLENPGFEKGLTTWTRSSYPYEANYTVSVDQTVAHTGRGSVHLESSQADEKGNAMLWLAMDGAPHQGKRVRMSAYLKSEALGTGGVEGEAWLYFRADGIKPEVDPGKLSILVLDDMKDRPVSGTTNWERYDLVLDVPTGAEQLVVGIALQGRGTVWMDDVQLEVVGEEVPLTTP